MILLHCNEVIGIDNNFSFRRDICIDGSTETLELDGTTEDVLRVLYALEQPAIVSPCLRTMLQEKLECENEPAEEKPAIDFETEWKGD